MLIKIIALTILLYLTVPLFGQECLHEDLTPNFTIETSIKRIKVGEGIFDSCVVAATIVKKSSKRVTQTLHLTSPYLTADAYRKCKNVRSYITGKNVKSKGFDNNNSYD